MNSPVPKHLRNIDEYLSIDKDFINHIVDFEIPCHKIKGFGAHRAKYAPGLSNILINFSKSDSIGDPMAGTGTIARETKIPFFK